jgi:hypothetical protein
VFETGHVTGFHANSPNVVEQLVRGAFHESQHRSDWLGDGLYFWLGNEARARQWALRKNRDGAVPVRRIIKAQIRIGHCLNLIDGRGVVDVRLAAMEFVRQNMNAARKVWPENKGGARFLDCAVINLLHQTRSKVGLPPFTTVIGAFEEGAPILPPMKLLDQTHLQIVARDRSAFDILSVFDP